jgi:hypothetical protein
MKYFFFFLILFFSYSLYSQGVKSVEHTSQYWLTYFGKFRVSNQLELIAESTVRSVDHSINKASQSLVLLGLSWNVNGFVKLATGYQHISLLPNTSKITVTQPEYRPWQQIQVFKSFSSNKITQRLRIEERFRKVLLNDSILTPETLFNFRFRYLISAELPQSKNQGLLKNIYLILSDEIFIQAGKQVVYNYFDQNRISTSFRYRFNEGNTLEFCYINLFQQLPTGNNFRNLNILRLSYFQNLDLRKARKG